MVAVASPRRTVRGNIAGEPSVSVERRQPGVRSGVGKGSTTDKLALGPDTRAGLAALYTAADSAPHTLPALAAVRRQAEAVDDSSYRPVVEALHAVLKRDKVADFFSVGLLAVGGFVLPSAAPGWALFARSGTGTLSQYEVDRLRKTSENWPSMHRQMLGTTLQTMLARGTVLGDAAERAAARQLATDLSVGTTSEATQAGKALASLATLGYMIPQLRKRGAPAMTPAEERCLMQVAKALTQDLGAAAPSMQRFGRETLQELLSKPLPASPTIARLGKLAGVNAAL